MTILITLNMGDVTYMTLLKTDFTLLIKVNKKLAC
jgi:hypothetical protein